MVLMNIMPKLTESVKEDIVKVQVKEYQIKKNIKGKVDK